MDPYFTELGKTVYELWKDVDFSLEAFPPIFSGSVWGISPERLKRSGICSASGQRDISVLLRGYSRKAFLSSRGITS